MTHKNDINTSGTTRQPKHHRLPTRYRWLLTIAVIGLLVYVLLPQTDALWRSMAILRSAAIAPVSVALLMTAMTYVLSAEAYHILAKRPILLRRMLLVQAATALTSRIAPVGVGTMGLNALFLRKQGHSLAQSLAVVAANNGLGIAGHLLLLGLIALTAPLPRDLDLSIGQSSLIWVLAAAGGIVLVLALAPNLRRRIRDGLAKLWHDLAGYRHQPRRLAAALAVNMSLSLVYVLALAAAASALGVSLAFNQLFMVYTFSVFLGAATPTPGGIVGVEAGLAGGLIAYGIPADSALAVALLYRLITYWLPLLPGFIAFRVVQHRYL